MRLARSLLLLAAVAAAAAAPHAPAAASDDVVYLCVSDVVRSAGRREKKSAMWAASFYCAPSLRVCACVCACVCVCVCVLDSSLCLVRADFVLGACARGSVYVCTRVTSGFLCV